eukprot:5108894-Pyramimonas_sp.AAC.1
MPTLTRYSTGEQFEGEWLNDQRVGQGIFTDATKTEYIEIYVNGELHRRYPKNGPRPPDRQKSVPPKDPPKRT